MRKNSIFKLKSERETLENKLSVKVKIKLFLKRSKIS